MASMFDPGVMRRRRAELLWSVERADSTTDVLAAASQRLRPLVPFDGATWVTTDPATGLPNGPTLVDGAAGGSAAECSEHWRLEFMGDDVNLYADLANASVAAGALRRALDDPFRSRRFRTFLQPYGVGDELRAVLRTGDMPWGIISLLRREGQPEFTDRDTALVAGLSEPLGNAVRARAHTGDATGGTVYQPGVLVFDADGELVSVNEEARQLLAEVPPDRALPTTLDIDVPLWLAITVFQARARAADRGAGAARCRLRTGSGAWLVCDATFLHAADHARREIAVVLERARPADIAPIVVEAYDLTGRERQITRLIARGRATAEIADELYVSAHTVRGYIKSIFRKLGVSSRGELVAKLFAEHYEPGHHAGITYADTSDGTTWT